MSFDVIVSAGESDSAMFLSDCVSCVIENVIGYRSIYVLNAPEGVSFDDESVISIKSVPLNLSENYLWVPSNVMFLKPVSFSGPSGQALQCWPGSKPEPSFAIISCKRAVQLWGASIPRGNKVSDYVSFMKTNYNKEILFRHLRGGTRKGDYDFIQI
jgi:hypothetical protein